MSKLISNITDSYKELPPWAKGIIFIGGLGAIYIFASQTVSQIKKQADEKEANKSVISAKDELAALLKKGIKPTISKSQADSWSDQIVKQFSGADLLLQSGSLVKRLFLNLKNDVDFLVLKTQFGIRSYKDAFFGAVKNVTLEAALQDELTNGSLEGINKQLAKQGITYKV